MNLLFILTDFTVELSYLSFEQTFKKKTNQNMQCIRKLPSGDNQKKCLKSRPNC